MDVQVESAVKLISEIMAMKSSHPAHVETYERIPWIWDHDLGQFPDLFCPFIQTEQMEEFKSRVLEGVQERVRPPRR